MATPRSRLVALGLLAACRGSSEPPEHAVAATREPIAIDGELSEPSWNALGDPQRFVHDGAEARPFSQVRFLHDADTLYVGLYAADQDIHSDEHFDVEIGALKLAVDPLARITPAIAGAHAAKDVDGTIDQAGDDDEEWVVELAIPLAATTLVVDGPAVTARAARCDTTKDGVAHCGQWTGALRLSR